MTMDQFTRPTADLRSIQLALSGEFYDRADVKRRMIGEVYRPWELKLADERWVADLTRKLCKERCFSHVRKGRICTRPLPDLPFEEAEALFKAGKARHASRNVQPYDPLDRIRLA